MAVDPYLVAKAQREQKAKEAQQAQQQQEAQQQQTPPHTILVPNRNYWRQGGSAFIAAQSNSPAAQQTGAVELTAPAGYRVVEGSAREETVSRREPSAPLTPQKETVVSYSVEPDDRGLELAKQALKARQRAASLYRGGTSAPAPSGVVEVHGRERQVTEGLNVEQMRQYQVFKQEKVTKPMANLGLALGASAVAPVLGPSGAVGAAGLGVGVSQGVKTGSYWLEGKDVSGSLLTPEEALTAAETGVIFAGLSRGAMAGLQATRFAAVVEGTGQGIQKVASGVMGRAAVNAGLGAGGGYVLSGGKVEGAVEGAAFGAAFSVGAEAVGAGLSRFRGYRVNRVVGASEFEKVTASQEQILSERLTRLDVVAEDVPRSYGRYLERYSRYFNAKTLELGGTEKVVMRGGDEIDTFMRSSLTFRDAEAFVNAAQGKSSLSQKGVGVDSVFAERMVVTSARAKGKVYQRTVISGEPNFIAEKTLIERDFTTAQFFGTMDRQVYLDFLRNVPPKVQQSWLRQMGGLSYEQQQKTKLVSDEVQLYTNIAGFSQKTLYVPKIVPLTRLRSETRVTQTTKTVPFTGVKAAVAVQPQLKVSQQKVSTRLKYTQQSQLKQQQRSETTQTNTPYLPMPQTPKITSTFSYIPLGGGSARPRGLGGLGLEYTEKKHKIKSPQAMLQTFGLGKLGAKMNKAEKAFTRASNKYKKWRLSKR